MLDELKFRNCAYWDIYPWFYISSIGAHLFNVSSLVRQVLYISGLPYDTRMHMFLVTYPGFGKTFWLFQFLLQDTGLIGNTRIPVTMEGYMTEAGWVGQFTGARDEEDPESNKHYGIAFQYATGIAGAEEFSAINVALSQSHSKQLDSALLTSLDSGYVSKSLGPGSIKYKTSITLWTGTQPARFDLTGGLGRRLTFMHFIPTDEDVELLRRTRREGFGKRHRTFNTVQARQQINLRKDEITQIKDVIMHKSIYEKLDKYKIMPYEEPLFERMAIGYWIMRGSFNDTLVLRMDKHLDRMFDLHYKWRGEVKRGSEFSQVLGYLRSQKNMKTEQSTYMNHLYNMGYDVLGAQSLTKRLTDFKSIELKGGMIGVVTRKKNKKKD